jgi:3-hydroxyacyl-[acyl-carrier-protein] dehydratase
MKKLYQNCLPKPFLFVDEIKEINENGVEGHFTFDEN